MRNSSVIGACSIILGIMIAVNGYQASRRLSLAAGVLLIIAGIIQIARPRNPSAPAS